MLKSLLLVFNTFRQRTATVFRGRPAAAAAAAGFAAVAIVGSGLYGLWFTADVMLGLPARSAIGSIGDLAQATTLYDINDKVVFTIFKEQRIEVPLAKVSPNLIKAVIAIEDQRFFDHRGIDLIRVAAAVLADVRSGRRAQGGSTITQQLARQSLLTRDKTVRRKVKEMLLAAQIEQQFSKNEILEMYLNKVYFGDGFHGVEAASYGYFSKHASDLTVAEAALLAGLIQSPSSYAPSVNPTRAIARRNVVLAAMRDNRAIDDDTFRGAKESTLALKNGLYRAEPFGLYFKELVRRELVDRFGWDRVSEGGLKVYTTIDSALQPRVEAIVEDSLDAIEARKNYRHKTRKQMLPLAEESAPDYLQSAVMVMDVATGEVRALVGGRNFRESRFNRAVQAKRQAGSAFKPFVYATALEQGMSPATVVTNLDDPVITAQGAWMPEEEHSNADSMTLRTALRTSSNRAAVQVLRTVGISKAVNYIHQFQLGDVPPVPSLALGAGEVTLSSMTAAFGAFANGGEVRKPIFIRRVEDQDGTLLFRADNPAKQAVSPVTAFLLSNMLADVINSGTAYKARADGFTLPAAGKTGTTNDYKDVWFVGYTPRLVTGVWMGFDQPKSIIGNGYAGDLAVPLWARVMKVATAGDDPSWLDKPDGVVALQVCRLTGKLPAEGCAAVPIESDDGSVQIRSMIYTEYFAKGTAPTEICDLHPAPTFFQRVAEVFGSHGREPVRESDLGMPPPPPVAPPPSPVADTAHNTAPVATETRVEEKPKKRSFWGRLFGRRDKPDDDDDKGKDDAKKDGQPK